jgi:hypothetical protein
MPTITIRIPEDLRRKMSEIRGVNWSEVVRRAILERIMIEEGMEGKNWDVVRRASEDADKIRMEIEARYGRCSYDSAETIRCWRDARAWRD